MNLFLQQKLPAVIIGLIFSLALVAQPGSSATQLQRLRQLEKNNNYLTDTAYANALNRLAFIYADSYPDSAITLLNGQPQRFASFGFRQGETDAYTILGNAYQTKGDFKKSMEYYDQSYQLAKEINYHSALPGIINDIGLVYLNQGNYPSALGKFYEGLKAAESVKDNFVVGSILNNIATIHFYQGKMEEAESDYKKMLAIARGMDDTVGIIMAYNNIGEVDLEQDSALKALQNLNMAYKLATIANNPEMLVASTKTLGNVYYKLDSLPKAVGYFETALGLATEQGNNMSACKALIGLAQAQHKQGELKKALANGLQGVQLAREMGQTQLLRDASEIVSTIYEALGKGDSALVHYREFKIYSDSINNSQSERAAATYKAEYEFSKKELEFQRKALQQRWLIFSAFAALISLCVIVWIVNRNRKRLDLANKTLQHKNLLIEAQKSAAVETLDKLRAAQSQLIQSEKMASFGELTAGIAHEIQNPLNFVNNFSELSRELMAEMKTELDNGNTEDVKEIAGDIMLNLEKINHHGKRADAIVKAMLQHSRSTGGRKEPTDINALVDEYIRLCYHGLKAKDPSFNVTVKKDLNVSLPKATVIPQEIGKALLNVLTNAFYAVQQKQQQTTLPYDATVWVSTTMDNDKVVISVKDNGDGIPGKIADKIFQPFFTTKPTGQGTGLGLSLSYEIIKGHGGELKTVPGDVQGATFMIILPV